MRKLISFNVCSKMLEIFYQFVVASVVFVESRCWGGRTRAGDEEKKTLNKLIKKAGLVLGYCLDGYEVVVEKSTLNKLAVIWDNK